MSSNLIEMTRELTEKSIRSQVSFKIPMLTKMFEMKQVIKGGLRQAKKMKIANSDDLVTEYGGREPLPGGSKDIVGTQKFNVAHMMHPIEIDEFDEIANLPKSDGKLLDKAQLITESATEGIRIRAAKRIWGCATDQEKNEYETLMQGIPSALVPATTYGFVTRTTSSNTYYLPAGYSNLTTAYNLSKRLIREWVSLARKYATKPGPVVVVLGTTLYNRLKDEFEASNSYHPTGSESKQGFRTMVLDEDIEIMEDPFLDDMTTTTLYHEDGTAAGLFGDMSACGSSVGGNLASYTGANCVFVLSLNSWKFRYVGQTTHDGKKQDAMIEITDPFDQSKIAGGAAVKLSRAFLHGNLCCEQPNINLARINVS